MWGRVSRRAILILLPPLLLLTVFCTNRLLVNAPSILVQQVQQYVPQAPTTPMYRLLKGKTASLSWIVGRDCSAGIQAYLHSASASPDAALVGTGWVDPMDGTIISGSSNRCTPGTLSMDSVIKLIHSRGGWPT